MLEEPPCRVEIEILVSSTRQSSAPIKQMTYHSQNIQEAREIPQPIYKYGFVVYIYLCTMHPDGFSTHCAAGYFKAVMECPYIYEPIHFNYDKCLKSKDSYSIIPINELYPITDL